MTNNIQFANQPTESASTTSDFGSSVVNIAKFGIEAYIAYLLIGLIVAVILVIGICIIMLLRKAEQFKSTRNQYHATLTTS